jgi:hypothetical protein
MVKKYEIFNNLEGHWQFFEFSKRLVHFWCQQTGELFVIQATFHECFQVT